MQLADFIKLCADRKVLQMFHAGARGGFEITCAVADDVHIACSKLASEEDGMGMTALRAIFPRTEETIRKHITRVEKLETELFPRLPEQGVIYHAEVTSFEVTKSELEASEFAIDCKITSLRPNVEFTLRLPLETFDEEHEWLYVELVGDEWKLA